MHFSRYQPLAGSLEHESLSFLMAGSILSFIKGRLVPSFLYHIFIDFAQVFEPLLLRVNVPFSFTIDRLSSILI